MQELALFTKLIAAVKTGDFKPAACAAGQLVTSLTCDKLKAQAGHAEGFSAEFKAACDSHCAELEAACDRSDHLVKVGEASNAALPPGAWAKLAALVLNVIALFVKAEPTKPQPVKAEAPPAPTEPPAAPTEPAAPPAAPGDATKPTA